MEYIKIVNAKQAAFYLTRGLKCVDVLYTTRFVYVFKADETKELRKEWKSTHVKVDGFDW